MVVGVQFNPIRGYTIMDAGRVYDLFRNHYPVVQEQPPLSPQFETFGAPGQPTMQFEFGIGFRHPRLWFLTPDGHELLQFQSDKLIHNWRQVDGVGGEYPHYEAIRAKFSDEVASLTGYMNGLGPDRLFINQAEISYINCIYGADASRAPRAEDWLKFIRFGDLQPEVFNGVFRRVVAGNDGRPVARLHCEINATVDFQGAPIILVQLTYRGAPKEGTLPATLDFLDRGRELLVKTFASITTDTAHQIWQRTH